MAFHSSSSPKRDFFINNKFSSSSTRKPKAVLISSFQERISSHNPLVFQAAKLLGPPARFEAAKLKVVFMENELDEYNRIFPRTYTFSHCDITANLTLAISNTINHDQLNGWYNRDDVIAEWKKVKEKMCLLVHCHVSGPHVLPNIIAEFRYHIFTKELPLVLKAVLHGESILFKEHPELMEALVWVYFHSSSKKYNHMECWGPLIDATQGRQGDQVHSLSLGEEGCYSSEKWGISKSIFQALVAILLYTYTTFLAH